MLFPHLRFPVYLRSLSFLDLWTILSIFAKGEVMQPEKEILIMKQSTVFNSVISFPVKFLLLK